MRVTIFDYGAGNIHSLAKAIAMPRVSVSLVSDPVWATATDLLVLPGVGAFQPAALRLAPALTHVRAAIRAGLPTLGICLGMQLLFDGSDEGEGQGIGIIAGRVTRLRASRAPQIGWNSVDPATGPAPLRFAYYANSYACRPVDTSCVTAWSTHEDDRFPAIVRRGSAIGVQFHPEKSSAEGVAFVRSIVAEARR